MEPCTPQICTNYSRCEGVAKHDGVPRFHVYPVPSDAPEGSVEGKNKRYSRLKEALRAHPSHTEDPDQACLFIPWFSPLCEHNSCANTWSDVMKAEYMPHLVKRLSHWDEGRNHIFFHASDHPSGVFDIGKGIWATTGMWDIALPDDHLYRKGYDIPIPLFLLKVPEKGLRFPAANKRRLLLSFKGSCKSSNLYNGGPSTLVKMKHAGKLPSRPHDASPRDDIHLLHNGEDIIVVATEDTVYSYEDLLLNATFGLVPAGLSPMSYRLAEVLAYGAIPVILSDFITLPFAHEIDWASCSIRIPEVQLQQIPTILRKIPLKQRLKMQHTAQAVSDKYFRTLETVAFHTLRYAHALQHQPQFMFESN